MPSKKKPLSEYDKKRKFDRTPEPSGARGRETATKRRGTKKLRFVVQQHHARRMHYDFRLEANGVLASWAVPKGPSLNTADRHLAVHVEDHPFDYRTFEGVIPAGNYGAGAVIVWDEGTWTPLETDDPAKAIAGGKLKFILSGKKLKGMFTLVKMRGARYATGTTGCSSRTTTSSKIRTENRGSFAERQERSRRRRDCSQRACEKVDKRPARGLRR